METSAVGGHLVRLADETESPPCLNGHCRFSDGQMLLPVCFKFKTSQSLLKKKNSRGRATALLQPVAVTEPPCMFRQTTHAKFLKTLHSEQLSRAQAKNQQECDLLEDIR